MTLTEFKRFADENNIVPVSTEIYLQMISDSVKYAKMKEVLQEICQEIESLTIARVDDNYVRNMAGLYCVKREIIEIIDKHISGMAESEDKCKNCKYYRNPDYTRCHKCKAESEGKE